MKIFFVALLRSQRRSSPSFSAAQRSSLSGLGDSLGANSWSESSGEAVRSFMIGVVGGGERDQVLVMMS